MPTVTINGKTAQVEEGFTILQAARQLGIDIPTLCHDERIKPSGGCRLCVVEVQGQSKLAPSCTTPVTDGMCVDADSDLVEKERSTLLKLLAESYPAEAASLDTPFATLLDRYGIVPTGKHSDAWKDHTHPYLQVDMDRCVYCYRCVRICNELQGQFVWRVWNRGDRTRIMPDRGETLLESSCVSCGACADTCPSGAIVDRAVAEHGEPTHWTRTTCAYCGTGCEMNVGVLDGKVIVAKPVLDAPSSKGHLCVKGRYAHRFAHAPDRVTSPMLRQDGEWREVSWHDAIGFVARELRRIIAEQGPGAVGVLGSARGTNEENYLAQKFARHVVGTNNVDCCARVCHAPSASALKSMLGTGAATNAFDDIELAGCFLISGCNPTENHPIVGARIKQAFYHGAKLIVVDPRKTELASLADVHLALRPGTNIPVLNAIAHVILEEDLVDKAFLEQRVDQLEAYCAFVKEWTPERAAELAGIKAEDIRHAAQLYASNGPSMIFHGLGMTEHSQGTQGVRCLINLALLTGNLGKPGAGENPLRGQNNVQGSAHMGCEPDNLAGFAPISGGTEQFDRLWGKPLPKDKGMNWMSMLDSASDGGLKALWAIGYDVLFSNPNASYTGAALENLDLLIVQDLFLNETARHHANVFFPACSSYEKEGTFMNSERRVQRVRKAIEPQGDSLPDWQIICMLAQELGFGDQFAYQSADEIWEEVRKVWKPGAGISYERLESGGIQWPCPSEEHPGTKRLHVDKFPTGTKASLKVVPYMPTEEQVDNEYPMLLSTGRGLYQFNAGTMTLRTGNKVLKPTDVLEISPVDAERVGLEEGDLVKIASRYGTATLPAKIEPGVKRGQLFTTFHDPAVFTNRVTGNARDPETGTPEYKVTAVRIERV